MKLLSSTRSLFILFSALASPAAILEYRAEFGSTTSSQVGPFSYVVFNLAGPKPTLNGTLNSGDQFRFVYSASPGYLFRIDSNSSGAPIFGFYADFWTDGAVLGIQTVPGTSFEFSPLPGSPTNPYAFNFEYDSENRFLATFETSSGDLTFKSISATFTVPQGYSRTFTNFTPSDVRLTAYVSAGYELNASLIPDPDSNVPEPASIFLVTSSIGVLALARHKRFHV